MSGRTYHSHKISDLITKITKPLLVKRGFYYHQLISEWPLVVGHNLASYTLPKKIVFQKFKEKKDGVLHIDVSSSALATELYYKEELIIEKIAVYFGYKAVTKIHIFHNPSFLKDQKNHLPIDKKILSAQNKLALEELTSGISDDGLRNALLDLGSEIMSE